MNDDKKLDKVLAAVEANTAAINKVRDTVEEHSKRFDEQGAQLKEQGAQLKEQGAQLKEQATQLHTLETYQTKMYAHFTNEDNKRDEQFEQIVAMFSKLHNKIDGIAADYTALRDEETIGAHLMTQSREQIADHEQRIGKLEQAAA
jgi:chromosome segregation ATPase